MVRGMSATHCLLAYLAAVVAVTFIHESWFLAVLLALALAASGAVRWKIVQRAVLAGLTFNLALWQGNFSAQYLLLVNMRVLLLLQLGFWFVARVNLIEACRFSPTLSFVVTLAAGQIEAFSRALRDFRLAFVSRHAAAPALTARARHAAAQAGHLLDKSVCMAAETALAMRSRGCFDDYAGLPMLQPAPQPAPVWRPRRPDAATAYRKP
jgi:cobalt/nickel transport system permease protein